MASSAATTRRSRTRASRIRDATGLTMRVALAVVTDTRRSSVSRCNGAERYAQFSDTWSTMGVPGRSRPVPAIHEVLDVRRPVPVLPRHGNHLLLDRRDPDLVPLLHGPVPPRGPEWRHEGRVGRGAHHHPVVRRPDLPDH